MEEFCKQLIEKHWGDLASIAGFVVSLIGFTWTIRLAWRSKTAAEMAREEVHSIRQALARSSAIADFAAAITTMNEIKRLHRVAAWAMLPDRYATLRQLLIAVRSTNPGLSNAHRTTIQNALGHFRVIEQEVERALASNEEPPRADALNRVVSDQIDALSEILEAIKQDVGN